MPPKRVAKVAMLAHTCYLTDPRVRREAETLADMGIEVHVISLAEQNQGISQGRNTVVNGVRIHRLPIHKKRGSFLRYVYEYSMVGLLGALKLARLHLAGRIDVVHVHNMPDILVLAGIFPRATGSRLVLDVHDPMPELYMSWNHGARSLTVRLLRFQERISCWLADRVISVNETMRENLRAKGLANHKISIVHNFPDQNHFPLCDLPEAWPRNRERLVLLYCGTITEHYDVSLAVKAIANLAREIPMRLKILGTGGKLPEILALASALGVRDLVEVLGTLPIEKVAEEMRKADVGISCHRAGIFGDLYFSTKIVEYLSQGLAVLSPRTQTINRYLADDCMFYFEPGDEVALTNTIRFVWNNPKEVLRRLTQARKTLGSLTWQSEKGTFCSFYAELLNNGSPRTRLEAVR